MGEASKSSVELSSEKEGVQLGQEDSAEGVTSDLKKFCSDVDKNAAEFYCQVAAGAFERFPEEVWGVILDKVVDSDDIRSVLLAFPELDEAFQSKKASWLFGSVLPHLVTTHLVLEMGNTVNMWTRSSELMKLRLVSKRWKYGVEKVLEDHTDRHPLLPREDIASGSKVVSLPENHFSYHRIRECTLAPTRFRRSRDIDRFLEEMEDYQGNPFPSKSVLVQVVSLEEPGVRPIVERAVALLEKFGEYVFDLEFEYSPRATNRAIISDLEMCDNILRCLSLTPNLRSLIFTGRWQHSVGPQADNFYGNPESPNLFPELRNLERFEWRVESYLESAWINRLVDTYAKKVGLRKLGIPLNLFRTVDLVSYPNYHLTELHILLDYRFGHIQNVARIEQVVEEISNNEEIRKFWLSSVKYGDGRVDITELIRMLAKFQFESVVLQNLFLDENFEVMQPISQGINLAAANITSLDLEDWRRRGIYTYPIHLKFEFLRKLPCLKFLTIYVPFCLDGTSAISEVMADWNMGCLGYKLMIYFMKAYHEPTWEIPENVGIWEEIPSLLSLSIVVKDSRGEFVHGERVRWLKHKSCNLVYRLVRECGNKIFVRAGPDDADWERQEVAVAEKEPEWESDEEDEDGMDDDEVDDGEDGMDDDEVDDGEDGMDDDDVDDGEDGVDDDEVDDGEEGPGDDGDGVAVQV